MALKPETRKKLAACCLLGALAAVPVSEGLRHTAYRDSGGIWTDCFGHTGKDVVPGRYQSNDQCDEKLAADLLKANAEVNSCVHVQLNEGQRTAFVDTDYNIGGRKFCESSIAREANAGNMPAACNAIAKFIYGRRPDGTLQVLRGLVARRERMRRVCLGIPS